MNKEGASGVFFMFLFIYEGSLNWIFIYSIVIVQYNGILYMQLRFTVNENNYLINFNKFTIDTDMFSYRHTSNSETLGFKNIQSFRLVITTLWGHLCVFAK